MKHNIVKRAVALGMTAVLGVGILGSALVSAADVADATIDYTQKGSITLYKYDLTNAEKDGVWNASDYVSTGQYDQNVNDALGDTSRETVLGNGDVDYGYALSGVEFSYLKIADVVQYTEAGEVAVLYKIDETAGADFLAALGLTSADQYDYVDTNSVIESGYYYFDSTTLVDALASALESNATVTKNALEAYMADQGGEAMDLTDSYGKTTATDLDLGLYLIVETAVPETVTDTTNPFLVTLPMTNVTGTNESDGGTEWLYDVTLYPKNITGDIITLEKTIREAAADTGDNTGSLTDITDGYSHVATASTGDVVEYQVISTMPTITSSSTYLSVLTFTDTLSKGITYDEDSIVVAWYTDADCTEQVAVWTLNEDYTVTFEAQADGSTVMYIVPTEAGYAKINTSTEVYDPETSIVSGYSDLTVRITYSATLDSDATGVFGDEGNENEMSVKWQRTSDSHYDTLEDHTHVYSYGIDLTKTFSDAAGNFNKVEFILHNDSDDYYVIAELNEDEGVYYVTGHTTEESEATHFVPVTIGTVADATEASTVNGKIVIKGLEDDTYTMTEVRTDSGYTLLKDDIEIVITAAEDELCPIYDEQDVLGLIQNDSRYALDAIYAVAEAHGYDADTYGSETDAVNAWLESLTNVYDANIKASTNSYTSIVKLLDAIGAFDNAVSENIFTETAIANAKLDETDAYDVLVEYAKHLYGTANIDKLLDYLYAAYDSVIEVTNVNGGATTEGGYTIIAATLYNLGSLDNYWTDIPQTVMEHYLLTASATVDGNPVNMSDDADDSSTNALAQLTVVNNKGFSLPMTGGYGIYIFLACGAVALGMAAAVVVVKRRNGSEAV